MLNWAKNIEYRASRIESPANLEELARLVADREKIKVLGSRHSFSRIADTRDLHLSLEKLPRRVEIDRDRASVTVSAGLPYGAFCETLHTGGFALPNLASLPHISVAGACATATHGSGTRHRNLAAAVTRFEMISAEGVMIEISRGEAEFNAAVVGLGALGIVTGITLELQPTYSVRQWVYQSLPMAKLDDYFENLMQGAYSVSLFTDWREDRFTQVWLKEKIDDEEIGAGVLEGVKSELVSHGAVPAEKPLHPVQGDPDCCTIQLGAVGPWYDRLPHFRMSFTPSAGKELQSEYFVARSDAPSAIRAINNLHEQISPLILVTEVRTVAADEFLMSPCCGRDSVAIHFTWRHHLEPTEAISSRGLSPEVENVLEKIEAALEPFNARPHLGKLFAMTPGRLAKVYQNLPTFRAQMGRYDRSGKFRNEFLDEYIMGVR